MLWLITAVSVLFIAQMLYPTVYGGLLFGIAAFITGVYLLIWYRPLYLETELHVEGLVYLFQAVVGFTMVFGSIGLVLMPLRFPAFLASICGLSLSTGGLFGSLMWLVGYSDGEPFGRKIVACASVVLAFSFFGASMFSITNHFASDVDWSPVFLGTYTSDYYYQVLGIGIISGMLAYLSSVIRRQFGRSE